MGVRKKTKTLIELIFHKQVSTLKPTRVNPLFLLYRDSNILQILIQKSNQLMSQSMKKILYHLRIIAQLGVVSLPLRKYKASSR